MGLTVLNQRMAQLTNEIMQLMNQRSEEQSVIVVGELKAARMIGISATTFSDLLHGRRSLSFDIARSLHKVLGVPAEVVLA